MRLRTVLFIVVLLVALAAWFYVWFTDWLIEVCKRPLTDITTGEFVVVMLFVAVLIDGWRTHVPALLASLKEKRNRKP